MFCPKCGKPLTDGAKFCGSCGAQVIQVNRSAGAGPGTRGNGYGPGTRSTGYGAGSGYGTAASAGSTGLGWILRGILGILCILLGFLFVGRAQACWDQLDLYLTWYDDMRLIGILMMVIFPFVLLVSGIVALLVTFLGVTGRNTDTRFYRKNGPGSILSEGISFLVISGICEILLITYEFDWSNSALIHTIWWVCDMYESQILFMLILSIVMIIVGAYLNSTGPKSR